MQCQQAHEYFSDYVDRVLDPALTVSVDNHVAGCANCRDNVAGLRRVWTQLTDMPQVEPPASLHAAITGALDAQQAQETRAVTRPARIPAFDLRALFQPRNFAYAMALVVLALGSLEVVHSQRAAFDPLGVLLRLIQPAQHAGSVMPAVTATRSEWIRAQDGGTLLVHLKAAVPADATLPALNYHADLVKGDPTVLAAHPDRALTSVDGHFNMGGDAAISLPIPAGQDVNVPGFALIVTLSLPEQNNGAESQRIVIPLRPSTAADSK